MIRAAVEGAEQIDAGGAAARAAPASAGLEADEDDRANELLGEARGDDPDDPGVPALTGENEAGCLGLLARQRGELALGVREHLALDVAALVVRAVELGRDLLGALLVGGQHQLDAGVGAIEASGGVDPRGEPEREVALVEALGNGPGGRDQRPHPGPPRPPRLGEPAADERAVLAAQRHQVGDRRERDEVELALACLGAVQRRRELVGDRRRAELGARVAGDDRVQDRRVGELGSGLVVVGDDHVDPGGARRRRPRRPR